MSKEEYLARAELAERERQRARGHDERKTFEEIARLWRALAERTIADVQNLGPNSRK